MRGEAALGLALVAASRCARRGLGDGLALGLLRGVIAFSLSLAKSPRACTMARREARPRGANTPTSVPLRIALGEVAHRRRDQRDRQPLDIERRHGSPPTGNVGEHQGQPRDQPQGVQLASGLARPGAKPSHSQAVRPITAGTILGEGEVRPALELATATAFTSCTWSSQIGLIARIDVGEGALQAGSGRGRRSPAARRPTGIGAASLESARACGLYSCTASAMPTTRARQRRQGIVGRGVAGRHRPTGGGGVWTRKAGRVKPAMDRPLGLGSSRGLGVLNELPGKPRPRPAPRTGTAARPDSHTEHFVAAPASTPPLQPPRPGLLGTTCRRRSMRRRWSMTVGAEQAVEGDSDHHQNAGGGDGGLGRTPADRSVLAEQPGDRRGRQQTAGLDPPAAARRCAWSARASAAGRSRANRR